MRVSASVWGAIAKVVTDFLIVKGLTVVSVDGAEDIWQVYVQAAMDDSEGALGKSGRRVARP